MTGLPTSADSLAEVAAGARRVVMVTSPGAEPARSTVAVNLVAVCAEVGQRVAVVSTVGLEIRPPGSDGGPGHPASPPVSRVEVERHLESTSVEGVSYLALQAFVPHPSQVVTRVPEVIGVLLSLVDVVIVEVPSFLGAHHGEALASLADAVLVVGESRSTTTEQMNRTAAILNRLDAPVVGMALIDPTSGRAGDQSGPTAVSADDPPPDDPTPSVVPVDEGWQMAESAGGPPSGGARLPEA